MTLTRRSALAGVAALLSGCAAQAPRPVGQVPPPDTYFTMDDGARLPIRIWRPGGRVRAVVLALHGFGDSRDAWEIPAPDFTAAGFAVYAPDQRGFGQAPGRGIWAGSPALVADARCCLRILRGLYPQLPLVLMGESMGGAVAMLAAADRRGGPADATVLLAPAVWARGQLNPAAAAILFLAAHLAPDLDLSGGGLRQRLHVTDNRAAILRLRSDPLTLRHITPRSLDGLVTLMTQAQRAASHMPARSLFLYGRNDELVPPDATRATWRSLPPGVQTGLYADGYHLLLRDQARALPIGDVIAWIDNPDSALVSGADLAAATWQAAPPA